jgi:hypothetical protein
MDAAKRQPLTAVLPVLIITAGERAATRFNEFFTVTIRNPNTRAAYRQAVWDFLHWSQTRRIGELPVLSSDEARTLLTALDMSTVVGLRDRAILAVMVYIFA